MTTEQNGPPVPGNLVKIAEARRHDDLARLRKRIAEADHEEASRTLQCRVNGNLAMAEQIASQLGQVRDEATAEIEAAEALSGRALVMRYVPEVTLPEPIPLEDALYARGPQLPRQVVVTDAHAVAPRPPVRPAAVPWGNQGNPGVTIPGVTYTYDSDGNLVPT
ncbi:MAG TPA: hypothetical protein VMF87_07950 [Streptosporangiaceae bacterium]|nr:hypothetical protein [Streptosporangiaceae bacterium]